MPRDFAAIRTIHDRQVLAWVENTHDDICLHLQFKFNDSAEADMKLGFGEEDDTTEESEAAAERAYEVLAKFNSGELDEMIATQIAQTEKQFPLTQDKE